MPELSWPATPTTAEESERLLATVWAIRRLQATEMQGVPKGAGLWAPGARSWVRIEPTWPPVLLQEHGQPCELFPPALPSDAQTLGHRPPLALDVVPSPYDPGHRMFVTLPGAPQQATPEGTWSLTADVLYAQALADVLEAWAATGVLPGLAAARQVRAEAKAVRAWAVATEAHIGPTTQPWLDEMRNTIPDPAAALQAAQKPQPPAPTRPATPR